MKTNLVLIILILSTLAFSECAKNKLDLQIKKLHTQLAHLEEQVESKHQLKKSTKREIQDHLKQCKTENETKTAAIKEQARLISELENQLKARDKELEKCKENSNNRRITATSCVQSKNSRLQMIRVPGFRSFQVACNSRIAGPGWMVIQRRLSGDVNFYRNWKEYKSGFGDLRREFFIGLEKLHRLTALQPHELYIQMIDVHNVTKFARYDNFRIGSEDTGYKLLSLGEYTGNAGDAIRIDESMKFTTYDRDNDRMLDRNCAQYAHGAWWYKSCSWSNLNGGYTNSESDEIIWWQVSYKAQEHIRIKTLVMLIRPKDVDDDFVVEV